tara:strand:+ start:1200 stop:1388 length:189 start_codon:yes stop_codon:yes gene_type:complete
MNINMERTPLVITDEMRMALLDLEYSKEDIEQMKPREGKYIIDNKIRKNSKNMMRLRRDRYQ